VRGGLDDALDKLARRDELRRRAAGEATGTPPAVQELVEAIVAVVGHNPKLAVTVGVEGAGDPVLLHFAVEGGTVQVSVDNSVASRVSEARPTSPRHADFDIEPEESLEEPAHAYPADAGQETRRISYDDRDRFDPGTGYSSSAYAESADAYFGEPAPSERRYESHRRYDDDLTTSGYSPRNGNGSTNGHAARESSFSSPDGTPYPPHPLAATPPPPVPPQTTRRIRAEQHRAPEEPSAAERQRRHEHQAPSQRGIPTPLPRPIPLHVDTEETELAARRLAALLRDNPSLLRQSPPE
jgi:hypothetical protein